MGQVLYKGRSTAPIASNGDVVTDADVDEEIARIARSLRPQLRISKTAVWAAIISALGHSAVAIALTVTHTPLPPAPQPIAMHTSRALALDWGYGEGQGLDSGAADGEEASTEVQAPEPEEHVAAAVEPRRREREVTPKLEDTPPAPVVDAPNDAAPVEALADASHVATRTDVPTGEQRGTASAEGTSSPAPRSTHGHGAAAAQALQGSARPSGVPGATGDGEGVDLHGMRRGHLARLNRAIRSQSPCSPELARRGLSGDVVVGLTQAENGLVDEVRVLRSSGEALIDETAINFVRAQRRLPRPDGLLVGEVWTLPLRFKCGR